MILRAVLPVLLWVVAGAAAAHEVRPAYLELHQTGAETYDVLWKPARGEDLRFGLYVELPPDTAKVTEPRGDFVAGSFVERWSVRHVPVASTERPYTKAKLDFKRFSKELELVL